MTCIPTRGLAWLLCARRATSSEWPGTRLSGRGGSCGSSTCPCDVLATSDEWGVGKPNVGFFDKLVAVSGHERHEIAYVGDRLDNDIAPAARAGLVTVWVRRGPWGYILRPATELLAGRLPEDAPTATVANLADLVTELNVGRMAGMGGH